MGISNNKKRKTHTILIPNNNNNEAANIAWLLNRYAEGNITVKELAELAAQRGIKRKTAGQSPTMQQELYSLIRRIADIYVQKN